MNLSFSSRLCSIETLTEGYEEKRDETCVRPRRAADARAGKEMDGRLRLITKFNYVDISKLRHV